MIIKINANKNQNIPTKINNNHQVNSSIITTSLMLPSDKIKPPSDKLNSILEYNKMASASMIKSPTASVSEISPSSIPSGTKMDKSFLPPSSMSKMISKKSSTGNNGNHQPMPTTSFSLVGMHQHTFNLFTQMEIVKNAP
eukprot:TRINITY_DN2755_c0_g1_i2.p1 TRINITY_DN2755_c0_g1~~TRINITY_DN2755_c0_g1_i2.p1  ORF type:complete len:140 (-),score=4.85 TRINITY_DN2755_c0_g1_i2:144-563(-)